MDDMLQVVWDHNPEAVVDAFEVEIVGLRNRLNTADRELENVRYAHKNNLDALNAVIEQRDSARRELAETTRAAEYANTTVKELVAERDALRAAVDSLLNPDNIAAIARENNKVKATKLLRDQIPLWRVRDSIPLEKHRVFVEAIWQVGTDSAQKMRDIYEHKE